MRFLLLFLFLIFGCCCGDLKIRDFWDWLFGRGFDVEFRACFEKASFLVGLKGAAGPGKGGFEPRKKNPFSKWIGSRPQVLACGLGPGMQKIRPERDPLPFLHVRSHV